MFSEILPKLKDYPHRVIGDCLLINGDAYEITPLIDGVDCLISDPPYIIQGKGCGLAGNRKYLRDITEKKLEDGFNLSLLDGFKRWAIFGSKAQIVPLIAKAEEQGNSWALITWNKPNPSPFVNNNYLPDTEYIIHSFDAGGVYGEYKDKARYIVHNNGSNGSTRDYDHPTVKPLAVMEKIIRTASDVGQVVFDPFFGTCSSGEACIRLGRKFIGIELDAEYYAIGCKRIEDAYRQPDMFVAPQPKPEQQSML